MWYPWARVFWQVDDAGDGWNDNLTPGDGKPRTFTQEEVNAFVAERAKHAKSSAIGDLLKELGFEKFDELKAAIQRQRETENASKTELQKAQEALAEYQKKEQAWAQEKRAQALQIAVQGASAKLGIVDAEVALALIREKVQFDEQGRPQNVEAALTELVNQKPYLKGAVGGGNPTNPPRGGTTTLTRADIAKMSPAEINKRWEEVSQVLEGK